VREARAASRLVLLVTAGLTMLVPTWDAGATPSLDRGKTLASGSYRMTDQNVTRTYRVFVPSRYQPGTAYPLVMVFHGWGGDENEFLDDKNVTTLADQRGYVVVAPRGLGSAAPDSNPNSWSFRGSTTGLAGTNEDGASRNQATSGAAICDPNRTPNFTYPSCKNIARSTCSWTQCQADDIAFALALVKEIESKLCVDTVRVFASGGSNGGMFTWELGQARTIRPCRRAPGRAQVTQRPATGTRTTTLVRQQLYEAGELRIAVPTMVPRPLPSARAPLRWIAVLIAAAVSRAGREARQGSGGQTCSTVEPLWDTRTTSAGRGS